MKLYYLLMHFDGGAVTGMIAVGNDPEHARKACIIALNKRIAIFKRREANGEDYGHSKRLRSFRRSLTKPWRRTKREQRVLEIMELPDNYVIIAGYWLSFDDHSNYICNVPRQRTQDPMGYYCSQPKFN